MSGRLPRGLGALLFAGSAAAMPAHAAPSGTPSNKPDFTPPAYALSGVNVAGAEFGEIPGRLDEDYAYPSDAILDYFLAAGVSALRIPFRWERLQPVLDGQLDGTNSAELDRVVARATARGATVILDMHNYGRRVVAGAQAVIAESGGRVTAAHLADVWGRIATRYRSNPRVVFGLMNEPHDQDGPTWVETQNATVEAIRAVGAKNLVLITGTAYSGAHSWESSGNARALGAAVDPGNHSAVEAHQYFDADHSGVYEDRGGSSASCTAGAGASSLHPFTDWLRVTGRRGFIGEFGAPDDPRCLAELHAFYEHLAENADVYLGATGWAAFPQTDYILNLAPPPDRLAADTPIFTTLRRFLLGRTKPLAANVDLPTSGVAGSSFPGGRIFGIGGRPGYGYDLASGILPRGLGLDPASGQIGTTTLTAAPGTYRFVPRVRDAAGATALAEEQTITVAPAPEGRFDTPTVAHFGYTNRAVRNHSFAGQDRYALVAVFGRDLDVIVSVTCGGRPMSRLAVSLEPHVAGAAIYGLADPPAGAQDITVTSGSTYKLLSVVVQGVTGVDQRRPVAAAGAAAGIDASPGVALSVPRGGDVWQAVNARDAVATAPLPGQTIVADADPPDVNLGQIRVSRRVAATDAASPDALRFQKPAHWRAAAVALRPASLNPAALGGPSDAIR